MVWRKCPAFAWCGGGVLDVASDGIRRRHWTEKRAPPAFDGVTPSAHLRVGAALSRRRHAAGTPPFHKKTLITCNNTSYVSYYKIGMC